MYNIYKESIPADGCSQIEWINEITASSCQLWAVISFYYGIFYKQVLRQQLKMSLYQADRAMLHIPYVSLPSGSKD